MSTRCILYIYNTSSSNMQEYDFASIMHYSLTSGSKNGKQTVTPKRPPPPGVIPGQYDFMSAGDIQELKLLFNCEGISSLLDEGQV